MTPTGCLVLSFAVRPPPSRETTIALPTASLVFVQYLAGLAVTETCRELLGQEAGARVRLKWPNDIYTAPVDYDAGKLPEKEKDGVRSRRASTSSRSDSGGSASNELKKLGGVLVSTNFTGGEVDLVVGKLLSCRQFECPINDAE